MHAPTTCLTHWTTSSTCYGPVNCTHPTSPRESEVTSSPASWSEASWRLVVMDIRGVSMGLGAPPTFASSCAPAVCDRLLLQICHRSSISSCIVRWSLLTRNFITCRQAFSSTTCCNWVSFNVFSSLKSRTYFCIFVQTRWHVTILFLSIFSERQGRMEQQEGYYACLLKFCLIILNNNISKYYFNIFNILFRVILLLNYYLI